MRHQQTGRAPWYSDEQTLYSKAVTSPLLSRDIPLVLVVRSTSNS